MEIKDDQGKLLAEYKYASDRKIWINARPKSEEVDALTQEINTLFDASADAASLLTPQSLDKLERHFAKLTAELPSLRDAQAERLSTVRYMKNKPVFPKAAEDYVIPQIEILNKRAVNMEKERDRFNRVQENHSDPTIRNDARTKAEAAGRYAVELRQMSEELRVAGRETRKHLIYQQEPTDVSFRYLAQDPPPGFRIKAMPRKKIGDDYIDAYTIKLGSYMGTEEVWHAHFHYKNNDDLPDQYTAAHLKNHAEHLRGKLWEREQEALGKYTRVYRARIESETAQHWFLPLRDVS